QQEIIAPPREPVGEHPADAGGRPGDQGERTDASGGGVHGRAICAGPWQGPFSDSALRAGGAPGLTPGRRSTPARSAPPTTLQRKHLSITEKTSKTECSKPL